MQFEPHDPDASIKIGTLKDAYYHGARAVRGFDVDVRLVNHEVIVIEIHDAVQLRLTEQQLEGVLAEIKRRQRTRISRLGLRT